MDISPQNVPGLIWAMPFVGLLLAIAILPLLPKVSHWWEKNSSKLLVSLILAAMITGYYAIRGYGFAHTEAGIGAAKTMLHHALLDDYIPFIVLLFSLYAISGGIRFSGDVPAHPVTNSIILLAGALLASLIGTTGASMLLIRPLLQINSERKHVTHTVIFFIFLVSNIGGALLPVGDPPLFLGFLRGVPFFWTLHLIPHWAVAIAVLLVVYYAFDHFAYRRERPRDITLDESTRAPLKLEGKRNFILLALVVALIAVLVPGKPVLGTQWIAPEGHLREFLQIALVALSFAWTPRHIRSGNGFNFGPMTDSILDNAPTYTVFFELAGATPSGGAATLTRVATATGEIPVGDLVAICVGAVFMGANTYIGNGPNFLVRGIAESQGVKMPSFFGYMLWSGLILIPLFVLISVIFFI
ncbi:MAG: sodium:proton antiporter [Candidatus Hydrogenedentes bacterium]|nr:sodium:proton antiporter [Candidatus Hydrogenedentota bacterium]